MQLDIIAGDNLTVAQELYMYNLTLVQEVYMYNLTIPLEI